MDQRAQGIILRTRPLTETSLIVQWLTPDFGRISTVAKGARRPKSPFRGKLDLYFSADFTYARSRRSDLHTLREVAMLKSRPAFRQSLEALQRAAYTTAFLEQVTEPEAPIPELAQLFEQFLDELNRRPSTRELVFAYELKMLGELGQAPVLSEAPLSEGTRRIAGHLTVQDWTLLESLRPSAAQFRELRHFLHGFLAHHLGRLPAGRDQALTEG